MKYNDLSLGQVEAIVNKLGGMEGVKNFLSGKIAIKNNSSKEKFIFKDFFFTQPNLTLIGINTECTETSENRYALNSIEKVCSEPTPYKSTKDLNSVLRFPLEKSKMNSFTEEEIRRRAVTMDQIQQLIEIQWEGNLGKMEVGYGYRNYFPVLGEREELFCVSVEHHYTSHSWFVRFEKYGAHSIECSPGLLFLN